MLKRLVVVMFLFAPVAASALTAEEIRTQIEVLLAQITALQVQLQATQTSNTGTGAYCPTITRTLQRGNRDTTNGEVTELQKFLVGYFNINPSEIMTGYFGSITEGRVRQFQAEQGITQTGAVGPLTRAALQRACGTSSNATQATTNTTNTTGNSCVFNSHTVTHGSAVTAYQNPSVTGTSLCRSEARTCFNGVLQGSYLYSSCTSEPTVNLSCSFGSQSIAHGSVVVAYTASSVAAGQTCISQLRTCSNGTLSGTYQYASCEVGTAAYSQGSYYSQASYYSQGSYSSQPSITVTSPTTGAVLTRGSTITITWQSQNAPADATVWIEFRQNPRFWDPTVVTLSGPASGSMTFTVPTVAHATSYNQMYFALKSGYQYLQPYAQVTVPVSVQ